VGLVLVGGAMSWGIWEEGGPSMGTAIVLDEDALDVTAPVETYSPQATLLPVRANSAPVPTGSYGPREAELRLLRRWRLLEPHTLPAGRPSSEVATPYVMPVTSAPGSGIRVTYPNAGVQQGGYVLTAPVH
jgi:hypothetical protein